MALLGPNIPMGVGPLGPIGQQQTINQPQEAFLWGQGGQRLTPEDIALQRQIADQQRMAGSDFSPVGSVWEGLGRVVNGFTGSYTRNQAEEAQRANQAESQSIAELLMPKEGQAPSSASIIAAALNPYIDDNTRQLALTQYQQMNARSEASSPLGKIAADEGFVPGTPEFNQRVQQLGEIDRRRAVAVEQGGSVVTYDPATGTAQYAVAPADLAAQLNSQTAPEIPQEAIDALRSGEGSAAQFDEAFGAGSAARVMGMSGQAPQLNASGYPTSMTPQQYQAVEQALGVNETADWARRNGIMVGQ